MTRPLQTLAYAAALAILCALGTSCAAPSIQSRLDALARPAAYPAVVGQTYPAKVVRPIDGDTLILDIAVGLDTQRTAHVRLAGIDTPERGEPGYREATAELAALVAGAQLRVTIGADSAGVETKSGDRYIGNVEVMRGGKWESVNGAMALSRWNKLRAK
jgi:endonuclease YncB( thermonuclease family)